MVVSGGGGGGVMVVLLLLFVVVAVAVVVVAAAIVVVVDVVKMLAVEAEAWPVNPAALYRADKILVLISKDFFRAQPNSRTARARTHDVTLVGVW